MLQTFFNFSLSSLRWMYNFQRQQTRKQKALDAESSATNTKDANGNISTIDAIALASEAKGHLNGIVSNVLSEHICDLSCRSADSTCRNGSAVVIPPTSPAPSSNGIDNKAFMPDVLEGADAKSENNTHL